MCIRDRRIPEPGEEVEVAGYRLKTLAVEHHRVQKVQIIPPPPDEDALDYEV